MSFVVNQQIATAAATYVSGEHAIVHHEDSSKSTEKQLFSIGHKALEVAQLTVQQSN